MIIKPLSNINKTNLPLASIYEPKISGWSQDINGKITIHPEGNFYNTEMILVTIHNKKIKK